MTLILPTQNCMLAPCPVTLHLPRDQHFVGTRLRGAKRSFRVRPGVYADAEEWRTLAPWQRYLARVYAVALTFTSPVFCLESAAALLGLPVFGEPRHIHLLDPGGKSRSFGDVVVHTTQLPVRVDEHSSVCVTSVPETAVALARVLPSAFALATADAAMRWLQLNGHPCELPHDDLRLRGAAQLRWVRERASPLPESTGESLSRVAIEWLGYARPQLQVEFTFEGVEVRPDFGWLGERVVGEFDGNSKYAEDANASREQLLAEKRREDLIRRHVNGFARWGWQDVMTATNLDRILRYAGLSPISAARRDLLDTLVQNPRSFPRRAR